MVRSPLGARGVTAEAAIARLCLKGLPALDLFERIAIPFRRAVPYSAGCWKQMDPRTLLWTGFGLEDGATGALAAARWRFIDNELLDRDYAKYRELIRRRTPVTTLHRETQDEPDRSSRHRRINRSLGFGAELRAMFCAGEVCWGSVALVRDEGQPDFSDQEIAFVARVAEHIAHGLRDALLRDGGDRDDRPRARRDRARRERVRALADRSGEALAEAVPRRSRESS
jgi:GAF domain-containing protein